MRFDRTIKLYMSRKEIETIGNFLGWLEELEDEEYTAISEITNTSRLYDAINDLYKAAEEDPFE